ncbi:MAG: acyl-CoA dehydrogenase family protein, partial [Humibacter sp.]
MSEVAGTEYAEQDTFPAQVGDDEFAALKREITEWVTGPGEDYAERIEADGTVPPELLGQLRERGYLSLAAPNRLGGRGIPFSRY